jgi:DNA-binding NtrC family response regulator
MTTTIQPIILVIDPDALTLMGLSATLHHQGLEVHGARTPLAAARAARDLALDLVIIDGWIDETQGMLTLEQLRALPHLVDLPCIFLWSERFTRPQLPMSAFSMNKPLDLEALESIVKRALWLPHLTHQPMSIPSCKFLKERSIHA